MRPDKNKLLDLGKQEVLHFRNEKDNRVSTCQRKHKPHLMPLQLQIIWLSCDLNWRSMDHKVIVVGNEIKQDITCSKSGTFQKFNHWQGETITNLPLSKKPEDPPGGRLESAQQTQGWENQRTR